ncbi:hypothetical protein HR12_28190 [Microbacterium sp. SUBG005]|nr:hypothetical protein HR12_28190 [Microbacterium sp. SUBG005]
MRATVNCGFPVSWRIARCSRVCAITPVIARDHQQSMIDPAHAREHIGQKLLVAGHVDKAQHATVGLRPVGVTQVNGHAALFLFRQAIGIHARNGLQ